MRLRPASPTTSPRCTSGRRARPARRDGRVVAALVAVLASAALASCAGPGSTPSGRSGEWVAFGPFEKPAELRDEPGLPGPATVRIPGAGTARLDAATLLPGETVVSEVYAVTLNEQVPMLAGIVQVIGPDDAEGDATLVTVALGIGAEPSPRVLTRTTLFAGPAHTSELAAVSDLGVVAVLVEGELQPGEPATTRTIGVDVARGTQVWWKDGGYVAYGEQEATRYVAAARDACVESVEEFAVASGRTLTTRTYDDDVCHPVPADAAR
ncbi:hypothetical protein EDD28_0242 [Salana multivorans]|uniref:Lipoprotein n=1 Tax=Salana multivorans TaxID=120377 RepID=A0A3N2D7C4_9MICO|nr:hypothetical protein [Salana multivorans]ROR95680.1 hypothetical protein EDD28_0242 [Salana multivorans]